MSIIPIYVGTYTTGESEGIYQFHLDTKEKKMKNLRLVAKIENPTYLALSPNKKYLYSVAKVGDEGGVAAFAIEENGELRLLNKLTKIGKNPCHVHMNFPLLFSGNYHESTVETYRINENGAVISHFPTVLHQGKSHVHCVVPTPDKKFLAVVDLGLDAVITYEIGENELIERHSLILEKGSGPRHLVFHPNGTFAYLLTEYSSEVVVLAYEDGVFQVVEMLSALPKNCQVESFGGAIKLSPNGKFLYASNRGHDSITAFAVSGVSGKLTVIANEKIDGEHPRDFAIDPTGKLLIVANRDTSKLLLLEIDERGGVHKTGEVLDVANPVCVVCVE